MRRFLATILGFVVVGLTAGLAGSFAGNVHPAGDSLAAFRGVLAIAAIAAATLAVAAGLRRLAAAGAVLAAAASLSLAPYKLPAIAETSAPHGLVLYQKNLSYRLTNVLPVLADIRAISPDVITLQEVNGDNDSLLKELAAEYPEQVICAFNDYMAVAVLSRLPVTDGGRLCLDRQGLAALRVETASGPVTVASLHLHWPWPHGQPRQVMDLEPKLAALPGPIVIGGDFNMVRWSATVSRIAAAVGGAPVGTSHVTFPIGDTSFLGLAIDHVIAPLGGETQPRPALGSDHFGLLARITIGDQASPMSLASKG